MCEEISTIQKKSVKILEVGCGSGRFCAYLKEHYKGAFDYTGVDISSGLIEIARSENAGITFVVADMKSFLEQVKQEEYDVIVGVASFQHLGNEKERLLVLEYMYRALKYGGKLLLLDRSYSERFLRHYRREQLTAVGRRIISGGRRMRNDLLIPRVEKHQTFQRFYHIFLLREIELLVKRAGFETKKICYVDRL